MRAELAIVTSCSGYGRYLLEWARSIVGQVLQPAEVGILTHGTPADREAGAAALALLQAAGLAAVHRHVDALLDFGEARNEAVRLTSAPWVMHLDADDELLPLAVAEFARLAPGADVVAFGYERSGDLASGPSNPRRIYRDLDGPQVLEAAAPCSGVSPFRRALWLEQPYRTDMMGAWDTALWIGFARRPGGIRIRATKAPVFRYRQHADSVFNTRRKAQDWRRAHTEAMLGALRRGCSGVSVIVPLGRREQPDRAKLWRHVRAWYEREFPAWEIVEGRAPIGPWCKGAAIADALERARGEILVIADADCLVDPVALEGAVSAVASGSAAWAVPHGDVVRLNAERTQAVLGGSVQPFEAHPDRQLARPRYPGFAGGGILVVPRVGYQAAGGIPRAFTGWGAEDQALAVILDCCLGPHWRGSADLVHLHHHPQARDAHRHENSAKLRNIRIQALAGRDALVRYLRLGMPAGGQEPLWRQRARAVADRLAEARRQRLTGGGG